MRLPTWEELQGVEEQLDVLEWPLDEPLFVAGPPGSGKTVLAVRRAQMVAEANLGVVVLTYNRMLRRLMGLLMASDPDSTATVSEPKVATMQSYVWNDYRTRAGSKPPTPPSDPYAYGWNDMLATLKMRDAGSSGHRLVVDEGQDLAEGFFKYASRHICGTSGTMSVYADDDQALSDRHTTLEQIKRAAGLPDPILLTLNHRNTPEIARLAEHFHTGRLPAAAVRRPRSGEKPRLAQALSLEDVAGRVATWHSNRGGSTGVIVHRNGVGRELQRLLPKKLPAARVDFYHAQTQNDEQINVLEDGVTVLNKESVKGQEFDTVFVVELHSFLPATTEAEKRGMYMMCSRARDNLWLVCGPDGRLTPAIQDALPGPQLLERA